MNENTNYSAEKSELHPENIRAKQELIVKLLNEEKPYGVRYYVGDDLLIYEVAHDWNK